MLKRHKAELLKAQKEGQRLGKKRAEEAAALVAQVNARHAAELAAFDANSTNVVAAAAGVEDGGVGGGDEAAAAVTDALAAATVSDPVDGDAAAGPVGKARDRKEEGQAHTAWCESRRPFVEWRTGGSVRQTGLSPPSSLPFACAEAVKGTETARTKVQRRCACVRVCGHSRVSV